MVLAPSGIAGTPKQIFWGPIDADDDTILGATWFSEEANSGGGDTTIQTTQAHDGTKSFRLRINTTSSSSGTRLELHPPYATRSQDGPNGYGFEGNWGPTLYYGAWYYIDSFVDHHSINHWFNCQQIKQFKWNEASKTTDTRQLLYYVNLEPEGPGTYFTPTLKTTIYENARSWNDDGGLPSTDRYIAGSDFQVPIATWFHLETMVQEGTFGNRDGRIATWLDGVQLWDIHNVAIILDEDTGDDLYTEPDIGRLQLVFNHYRDTDETADQDLFVDEATAATYRQGPTQGAGDRGTGPKPLGRAFYGEWTGVSGNPASSMEHYLQPGDDRMVLIAVCNESTSAQGDQAVTSVEYNSVSATLLDDGVDDAEGVRTSGDHNRVEIWGIHDTSLPTEPGFYDIDVTMAGTVANMSLIVMAFSGVDQSYTVDEVVNTGARDPAWSSQAIDSLNITTGVANCTIVDAVCYNLTSRVWPDGEQARIDAVTNTGSGGCMSWRREASTGTYAMGWAAPSDTNSLMQVIVSLASA